MRIGYISGSHRRHRYYFSQIAECFDVVGGVIQWRENMIPQAPVGIHEIDADNWRRHFINRDTAEIKYFGDPLMPCRERALVCDAERLNTAAVAEYIQSLNLDILLVFGAGMIREPLLSALPTNTVNLHLGLSPRYRGAATLFWPFYFLEPNWAGVTFHKIVHSPDAGRIIHQSRPELDKDDGIHDVSCRAVGRAAGDIIDLLSLREKRGYWTEYTQKPEAGKNFLQSDFKPQHLRMIYNGYNDRMVDAYLNGELTPKEPKLIRQEGIDNV